MLQVDEGWICFGCQYNSADGFVMAPHRCYDATLSGEAACLQDAKAFAYPLKQPLVQP